MAADDGVAPATDLSYEQARAELEDVVRRLETADLPLDDLMALWERGETLATVCEARLVGARARLDAVREARRGVDDAADPEA